MASRIYVRALRTENGASAAASAGGAAAVGGCNGRGGGIVHSLANSNSPSSSGFGRWGDNANFLSVSSGSAGALVDHRQLRICPRGAGQFRFQSDLATRLQCAFNIKQYDAAQRLRGKSAENATWDKRLRGRCSLNGGLSIRSESIPSRPNVTPEAGNNKGSISKLELGRNEISHKKRPSYNAIFLILLLNLGIFVGDRWLGFAGVRKLYLYHDMPRWYQFITSTFCHLSWKHLSGNLFFLYIFGKLVEEEGGGFAVWLSYIITGVGANLVSWLILPRTVVSAGASGAVFGLFAISVLVKLSFDWRKILEVLILGQFVVEKVMEAAQSSAQLGGHAYNSSMNINHIAHLSGALVGVALIWVLKRLPSGETEKK